MIDKAQKRWKEMSKPTSHEASHEEAAKGFARVENISRWAILSMVLVMPVAIYGALHLPTGSAAVHQWLPEGRPERLRYERFVEDFGTDLFVLVSWEGCTLEDERLASYQDVLTGRDFPDRIVDSVITTSELLKTLTDPPLQIPLASAKKRLQGFLLGADGTAAVVIRFTPYGLTHQKETIQHLRMCADEVDGLGRDSLRMAGSLYEAYAVDEAAEDSLKRLVLPSSLLGILLSWICLKNVRAAMAVLIMAGVGVVLAIAMVYYTGGQFSAVLVVLPTLVFMLTLSGAVHFMNYYVDVSAWHKDHLGSRALVLGFKPSLCSTITTALGMAALATSQLSQVRGFGIYSATALCVSTGFLLLAFPVLSDWFCSAWYLKNAVPSEESEGEGPAPRKTHIAPSAMWYTAWIKRRAMVIVVVGFTLIGISAYGFWNLKASTKFDVMFPKDSPTLRDMTWIEEHLGAIASVEVLVRFPLDTKLNFYDRVEWLDTIANRLSKEPVVGGVMGASSMLPALPSKSAGRVRDVTRRAILRKRIEESYPKLRESGLVTESHGFQIWRITAKVSAMSKHDYGYVTDRIVAAVNDVDDGTETIPFEFEVTGLSPVMHETQLAILKDLGSSFTTAFILITPIMMLISRGFWAGLLIMIPNVLPETLVFGMMSWMGYHLDIAGILTASIAMGIAVNDTLHFVNWYARRLQEGDSREVAIADTLTSCAGAMFHTMLISCCSMLPFMFAQFNPTKQFAILMIAMMSSSILGDLVLLPALLMSPLGRCLRGKSKTTA